MNQSRDTTAYTQCLHLDVSDFSKEKTLCAYRA